MKQMKLMQLRGLASDAKRGDKQKPIKDNLGEHGEAEAPTVRAVALARVADLVPQTADGKDEEGAGPREARRGHHHCARVHRGDQRMIRTRPARRVRALNGARVQLRTGIAAGQAQLVAYGRHTVHADHPVRHVLHVQPCRGTPLIFQDVAKLKT